MDNPKTYTLQELYQFSLVVSSVDESGDGTVSEFITSCDLVDPMMTAQSFFETYLSWAQGYNWRDVVEKFIRPKWYEIDGDGVATLLFDYDVRQDGLHGHREMVEMAIMDQYQCDISDIDWRDARTCEVTIIDENTVH